MDCLDALLSSEAKSASSMRETVRRTLSTVRLAHLEDETLQRLKGRDDAIASWIAGALLDARGEFDQAASRFSKVVDSAGREVPDTLIHRARIALRREDPAQASALLRLALSMHPSYSLMLRSESMVQKLRNQQGAARHVRIALLSSSTTSLLKSTLTCLFFRDRIKAELYEVPFGGFQQEILDDNSALYRFAPEFVVILVNWRDCAIQFAPLWQKLLAKCPCLIIQPTFYLPPADPFLGLSSVLPEGPARVLREANRHLLRSAPSSVTLLDTDRMSAQHPGPWEDALKWSSAKLYPTPDALPILAEHITSSVRASLGLSSKLLALDLDNTLWGGVIGEDGLGGIALGPPSAIGERFQDVQRYAKALQQRGILLAAISKNNPADAEAVFRNHDSSILKLDDFVALEVNWQPKSDNLRRIASKLNLGLESFVFLDDNPAERAAVRQVLPEVIVPEISGEPSDSLVALELGLYFQARTLTGEDKFRTATYIARPPAGASNLNEYLLSLNMELSSGPVDETTCERVTQLINKTNQFNLTTRRYNREQVSAFSLSPNYWLRWFRLKDRFADHGLIAILLVELLDHATWRVDLWLMSCRVIGREMEHFMFKQLLKAATQQGVQTIVAEYIETPKNGLVKDMLTRFGFTQEGATKNFRLHVPFVKP